MYCRNDKFHHFSHFGIVSRIQRQYFEPDVLHTRYFIQDIASVYQLYMLINLIRSHCAVQLLYSLAETRKTPHNFFYKTRTATNSLGLLHLVIYANIHFHQVTNYLLRMHLYISLNPFRITDTLTLFHDFLTALVITHNL